MIRKSKALSVVDKNPDEFQPRFPQWLNDNYGVFLQFACMANKEWQARTEKPSARTIIQNMRHEFAIAINDHATPDMSRLYMMLVPHQSGLFELRNGQRKAA